MGDGHSVRWVALNLIKLTDTQIHELPPAMIS